MYDPRLSYDDNYNKGPFVSLLKNNSKGTLYKSFNQPPRYSLLGTPLLLPLGIAAGPLLHSKFLTCGFAMGFSVCTYKTVRSRCYPSHPWPNVVDAQAEVDPKTLVCEPLSNPERMASKGLSISNSFGVPSKDTYVWQEDLSQAKIKKNPGQMTVLSFQGTRDPGASHTEFLEDWHLTATQAALAARAHGICALEMNLSCPNEGGVPLFCDVSLSTEVIRRVAAAIRDVSPTLKLIAKIGIMTPSNCEDLLRRNWFDIHAWSAINTLPKSLVNTRGEPILGPQRLIAGVCGEFIFKHALAFVTLLHEIRCSIGATAWAQGVFPELIAVGGAHSAARVLRFLQAGANHVQVATAAMWRGPVLVEEVATALGVS